MTMSPVSARPTPTPAAAGPLTADNNRQRRGAHRFDDRIERARHHRRHIVAVADHPAEQVAIPS